MQDTNTAINVSLPFISMIGKLGYNFVNSTLRLVTIPSVMKARLPRALEPQVFKITEALEV